MYGMLHLADSYGKCWSIYPYIDDLETFLLFEQLWICAYTDHQNGSV